MEISDVLKLIGLDNKEASVYLALLELGTATVNPIANKADIKRPTTYLILDQLQKKGLVSVVPRAKKALYTAENPDRLLGDLQKKQEMVKRFLPNMMALYNAKVDKPQVLLFEGKEAVRGVYEKILNARTVDFFCTIRDVVEVYPDFPKQLMQKTLDKQIKMRELLTQSKQDIAFAKTMAHTEYYEHRFAQAGQEFLTDNVLYDGNVVFFSYEPYIFAVQIQSKGIYQSLKTLFDLAWQSAESYEKIIK